MFGLGAQTQGILPKEHRVSHVNVNTYYFVDVECLFNIRPCLCLPHGKLDGTHANDCNTHNSPMPFDRTDVLQ